MGVELEHIMRFGYALIILTVGLMIYASSVQAIGRDIDKLQSYPPCSFSQLCTCSKSSPEDLGIVQCINAPFAVIPEAINHSKVFKLKLDNTGLIDIEPFFLQATGLYRLEISNNPIYEVPDDAFNGLQRTLWELTLRNNHLTDIPSRAIKYLQKLRYFDISANEISDMKPDTFRGLASSLQSLNLAENLLSEISAENFRSLLQLESLDLSDNNIHEIADDAFRDQINSLFDIDLSDNLLTEIPYIPLLSLKRLKYVDISNNRLTEIQLMNQQEPFITKLNIDQLHLEHNQIRELFQGSFQYFAIVNQTYLDYNPIHHINTEAFQPTKIRELYLRHCLIDLLDDSAFHGLEQYLEVLDITGNNISTVPQNLFYTFEFLRSLNLKDNKIVQLLPTSPTYTGSHYTLSHIDISGDTNTAISIQDFKDFKNLRSLIISQTTSTQLSPELFIQYGVELRTLKITFSSLKSINRNAFVHIRSLINLDLSDNEIDNIDKDAFQEISHSLFSLKIANGLSSQVSNLPEAIKHLTSLEELDFSNNKIKSMSDTCFHFLKSIRILQLNDNLIEQLFKGTFQRDIHSRLEIFSMNFNQLRHISTHTFFDLENLRIIKLKDNKIERVERRAFMNLDKLKYLSLRGNKINTISDEAFQNLPELNLLDIAYNDLVSFDFDFFDQVGTLGSLKVNASFNKISELNDNSSFVNRDHGSALYHSNIRSLDLSNNNITHIMAGFFRPTEMSLNALDLSHNTLVNATRDVFGNFYHLQWIDLSNNHIESIESDTFWNTKRLEYINLAENFISDISYEAFRNIHGLRVVILSNNNLRSLPDNLFSSPDLETIDLSYNLLTKIPVTSLSNSAAMHLCVLNLSHNNIHSIQNQDLSYNFKNLAELDLSNNRLTRLEDSSFSQLPQLQILDLSNNNELEIFGRFFIGLEHQLMELSLENVSIRQTPDLPLPNLRVLRLSNNELPSVPTELASNLSSLRLLDLSENDLTAVPVITHSLKNLNTLMLSGNPITSLTNTSLLGPAKTLIKLDISNFDLNVLENGALDKLQSLRFLKISTYPNLLNLNIPILLENVQNLRELWIEAPKSKMVKTTDKNGLEVYQIMHITASNLRQELTGTLPNKLNEITISGTGFNHLADDIFTGLTSSTLTLNLKNTSISSLPLNLFKNIGHVYNVTLTVDVDNKELKKIPNPNTAKYPNSPDNVFLNDISIPNYKLTCDCDIGWIEWWQRKRRQYICNSQTINQISNAYENACDLAEDSIRTTKCTNKNNHNLLDVLKTELECGWNNSGRIEVNYLMLSIAMISFILFML